ncbi:hypothetical protein BN406_04430 (plasmid) [Sinorhizobium meliloti Rm41]|nr:hypothetical protein BN406_04430 [Sinorhizobium meliloti Rm41]
MGKSAVNRVARILLAAAERLPAGAAWRAASAGGVQPRHADSVPFLQSRDLGAELGNVANALVPGNEGRIGSHWPVALGGMQVGVTHARGLVFDQDLSGSWLRNRNFLNHKRLAELSDHSGCHRHVDILQSSMLAPAEPALRTSFEQR